MTPQRRNRGEKTIEVSSETTPATQRATTPSFARSLRRTMQVTACSSQTITVQDTTALNSPVPADYTVECSDERRWMTPQRRTTAVR